MGERFLHCAIIGLLKTLSNIYDGTIFSKKLRLRCLRGFLIRICTQIWENTKLKKHLNPLSTNPTKWSDTLLPTNCLCVFDHFVGLALKELINAFWQWLTLILKNYKTFQSTLTFSQIKKLAKIKRMGLYKNKYKEEWNKF